MQTSSTLTVTVSTTRDPSQVCPSFFFFFLSCSYGQLQPGCAVAGEGLSTGAIIGIAVGCGVAGVLLFIGIVLCCRRRELTKRNAIFMSNMNTRDSRV